MKNQRAEASSAKSAPKAQNGLKEVKKPKKKRGLRYVVLYLAVAGFAFYAVITIINQSVRIAEKKSELSDLKQKVSVVEVQTQHLQQIQGYKGNDLKEYIEKIAREELGYVGDGERIFINISGD